jgi:hypothetical protein
MADEAANPAAGPTKSKATVIAIAAILLVEAVLIIGAMKLLGGNAAPASAVELPVASEASEDDRIVETLVLDARMPNNRSGITYIYATEVYVQVKRRHLPRVKGEIEQFQNEIKADITAIWRTAEPQHFQEPRLETLTRKVYALMHERFGNDKEHKEPVVTKVVIVMSTGFRVDS